MLLLRQDDLFDLRVAAEIAAPEPEIGAHKPCETAIGVAGIIALGQMAKPDTAKMVVQMVARESKLGHPVAPGCGPGVR